LRQQPGQHARAGGVGLGHQRQFSVQRRVVRGGRFPLRRQAEPGREAEGAAPAGFAVHAHVAAHELHQRPHDGQPKARAAEAARHRGVGLAVRFEQPFARLGRDADARVAHREGQFHAVAPGPPVIPGHADDHLAPLGELEGVGGQVHQHLAQPQRVAHQHRRHVGVDVHHQLDVLDGQPIVEQVGDFLQQVAGAEGDGFQGQASGLQLGKVQHAVDHAQQRPGRGADQVQVFPLLGRKVGAEGDVHHADDGVHGRAQFVGDPGQEFALGAAGPFHAGLGGVQRGGAFAHHAFQFALLHGQLALVAFHLFEHGVEGVHQPADLVVAVPGGAQGVVAFLGHLAGH
jgi:hypothetical protein